MSKESKTEILIRIISENPGVSFTSLVELVPFARSTLATLLNKLIEKGKISKRDKGYWLSDQTKIKERISNIHYFTNLPIYTQLPISFAFILDLYELKRIRDLNLSPEIEEICVNIVKKKNKDPFEYKKYTERITKIYQEDILKEAAEVMDSILKDKSKEDVWLSELGFLDEFKFLLTLETSLREYLQISFGFNQEVVLSNSVIRDIDKNIFNLIFESIIFNPEFLSKVKNIEDFKININISYDPLDKSNFFNLNFLSSEFNQISKRLRQIIFDYKDIDENIVPILLQNAKNNDRANKENIENLNRSKSKLKIEYQKIIQDPKIKEILDKKGINLKKLIANLYFFTITQLPEERNIEKIYQETIRSFKGKILIEIFSYKFFELLEQESLSEISDKLKDIIKEFCTILNIQKLNESEESKLIFILESIETISKLGGISKDVLYKIKSKLIEKKE